MKEKENEKEKEVEIKQSIYCEISIENYKNKYPLLKVTDLCPECEKYDVQCIFFKHKKKINYFYAYENKYNIINLIRINENAL